MSGPGDLGQAEQHPVPGSTVAATPSTLSVVASLQLTRGEATRDRM